MPEPLSVTLALAIAAGAAATSAAVKDAYHALKNFISIKYKRVNTDQIESDPASKRRQEILSKELAKAGAEHDHELRVLATDLVSKLANHAPDVAGLVGIDPNEFTIFFNTPTPSKKPKPVVMVEIAPPLKRPPARVLELAPPVKKAGGKKAPPSAKKKPSRVPYEIAPDLSTPPCVVPAFAPIITPRLSEEPLPSLAPASVDKPAESREITVTGHTLDGDTVAEFKAGETYQLRFRVGPPAEGNLAFGDTAIADVPTGGLKTHWVVTSKDAEFVPALSTAKVQKIATTWLAEFDLLIPETGSSKTETVGLLGSAKPGKLLVTIYAVSSDEKREVYREVSVNLKGRPAVEGDQTCKSPNHTLLRDPHEWTTPPVHIQVSVIGKLASITTKRARLENYEFFDDWMASDNLISGAIQNVRDSLEKFRELQETYLNDLDSADIARRVRGWPGQLYGWQPIPYKADSAHSAAFDDVRKTDEWRLLARDGYQLFDRSFPKGTKLRALFEKLLPGSRIDFHWSNQSGAGWVSHVPWTLMFMEPVDVTGQTLADPEKFLGLRFRIGTRSWPVNNGSVVLGGLETSHSMNLMYWGDKPGDDVGVEAQWQATEYRKWSQARLLPDSRLPDLKKQIVLALDAPGPSPVSVLYFYCHCSVGDGAVPVLRFGNTSKREDIVERGDLSLRTIPDGPLIFANACTTAQADPHMTSELEQSFFERGVRAFIGTETKVPTKLASKFAWLYFQFLYRTVAPGPMSAGEALTQTRMFLWTQYKNIGGLFYSMANQYDLYVASEAEVLSLR